MSCCLSLSSVLQVRKAVALGAETEVRGTMMIGQAIGLNPRLTTNPPATPPQSLPKPRVCENETAQSGIRTMAMEERSPNPAGSRSPRSLCGL